MWHWRPEPGWQPSWWQSHAIASIGFILSLPAMLPASVLADMRVTSSAVGWLAIAFGFVVEFVLTYGLVYFVAKLVCRALWPPMKVHLASLK